MYDLILWKSKTYRCWGGGSCHIIRPQVVMIAGLQHFIIIC